MGAVCLFINYCQKAITVLRQLGLTLEGGWMPTFCSVRGFIFFFKLLFQAVGNVFGLLVLLVLAQGRYLSPQRTPANLTEVSVS